MLQMSQFKYFPVTFNRFIFSVICITTFQGMKNSHFYVQFHHVFDQLLHLPKEKGRNNITYCVWLLVFVEFLIFEVSLCNILFVMWMVLVQFDVWEVILMESALEVDLASSSSLEQQYELACSL